MEEKIFRYISRIGADKIRLTELIAHFTHDIPSGEKENLIFKKILPALLSMEKDAKIKLSWDVMLTRYRFPRYIYYPVGKPSPDKDSKQVKPLWQKQIEDILRKEALAHHKRVDDLSLQDKYRRFFSRYEKSSEEIAPSEEWVKVLTAFMEMNLSQYDVMRACVEAFKAGIVWEKYQQEFRE